MLKVARQLVIVVAGIALGFGLASQPIKAAEYPTHPIRLVIPYAAGGATDVLGRALANVMSEDLKQAMVVENRGGAQGGIGAQVAAKAAPDGYTLFIPSSSLLVINPLIYKKLTYDPAKDFRMISIVAENPIVLVVRPSLPVNSVAELIEYAKKTPGKLTFGSGGIGTATHISDEMLQYSAGIDMIHVPFSGTNPAITSLLGGQIDLMFAEVPTALPHIQSGALRALAVASAERLELLPQVPTMVESGFSNFIANVWFGIAAPAKTPDDIVTTVRASADRALANEEFRTTLRKLGFVVGRKQTSQEIDAVLQNETSRWAPVISAQKISVE